MRMAEDEIEQRKRKGEDEKTRRRGSSRAREKKSSLQTASERRVWERVESSALHDSLNPCITLLR